MSLQLREALQRCRAAVQTDTLTLTLDLSVAATPVQEAILFVLGYSGSAGTSLPVQEPDSFRRRVQAIFADLGAQSEENALAFATLLSALVHECRHVHDLRASRIGCELLLRDLLVYAGVDTLVGKLLAWQRRSGRGVPWPFGESVLHEVALDDASRDRYVAALRTRETVDRYWTLRAPTGIPLSIKDLVECLGFCVQIEWLADVFGYATAGKVLDAVVGEEVAASPYLRPALLLESVCSGHGVGYAPMAHDLPYLLLAALNASGLDEAFGGNVVPKADHPGHWFERFAYAYAALSRSDPILRPKHAVDSALASTGGDQTTRRKAADEAIRTLQRAVLGELGPPELPLHRTEPLLIGAEAAIDFSDMTRAIDRDSSYHAPAHYVGMLFSGKLTAAHVLAQSDTGSFDFRTPSEIAANQLGAARIASIASQRMRILAFGRGEGFFEASVFRALRDPPPAGLGLAFEFRPSPR